MDLGILLLGRLGHVHIQDVIVEEHSVSRICQNMGYFFHIFDFPDVQIRLVMNEVQGLFFEA